MDNTEKNRRDKLALCDPGNKDIVELAVVPDSRLMNSQNFVTLATNHLSRSIQVRSWPRFPAKASLCFTGLTNLPMVSPLTIESHNLMMRQA